MEIVSITKNIVWDGFEFEYEYNNKTYHGTLERRCDDTAVSITLVEYVKNENDDEEIIRTIVLREHINYFNNSVKESIDILKKLLTDFFTKKHPIY